MTRRQRNAVRAGIVLGSLLLLLLLGLLVLTRTDWGRAQVRGFALERLNDALDGTVEIGRLEGDLLRRWRLADVSIIDPAGVPFVVADTLATGFSLRSLFRRQIVLRDVLLVNANVLLDQPPGEDWNFARILPEPDPDPDPEPGWGDWIRLDGVTIIGSRITIRSEWKPDPELSPAEQEAKIAEALSGETRDNIQRVDGGFQNVMDFRAVDALLDEVLLADPDVDRTIVNVDALRAIAQPFRPPVADIRGLDGRFQISSDSVWFSDVRARLPGSRLAGEGAYHLETGDLFLTLQGEPAAFDDLRWLYPPLPESGGGRLRVRMQQRQAATRLYFEDMDLRVGDGTLAGDLRLVLGDTFRILPTDLTFRNLDSRPVDRVIEALDFPRQGVLDGRLALQGHPASMRVDGDVAFADPVAGRSRVLADGVLGMEDEIRFTDLRVTLRPLRTDLIRPQVPRLPPGGALTGQGTVDGVLGRGLRLDAAVTLDDPATGRSRVLAAGGLDPSGVGIAFDEMVLRLEPLRADLVRPELPQLPAGAAIAGVLRLDGSTAAVLGLRGDLAVTDPATGRSRVLAAGGLDLRDDLRLRGLDLTFDPLRLDLVRGALPELPPGGIVEGRLRLDGDPQGRLGLVGDVVLQDPATGESRVAAAGAVDLAGELTFRSLDVRVDPFQLPLVQRFEPDFPLGGTLAGTATLDGRPGARLAVRGDLTHVEAGERSRVAGVFEIVPDAWARADVRLAPLSLETVGRFAPEAALRGAVSGRLEAAGDLGDLTFAADLAVADGGEMEARGWLDLAADRPGYRLTSEVRAFDLAAVTGVAPAATRLTGTIEGSGRGVEPATMEAELRAGLVGSAVDDVEADEVRLRLGIQRGLARVDSSFARLGPARAWADGSFGLVGWRDGELRYDVLLETLESAAPFLAAGDTTVVLPREGRQTQALAEARAEAERAERRRLVELIATGRAPPPEPLPTDTLLLVGIPRDTIAGRLEAAGVVRGNIELFDVSGVADVEELVVGGQYVGSGRAEYAWIRRGPTEPIIELDAEAERLMIEGFALDSARATVRHRGDLAGSGQAVVTAWQDDDTDYRADVEFTIAPRRGELLLQDVELRFDTLTWQSMRPGRVVWEDGGIEVDDIELASDQGGLIVLDGVLPVEGEADLHVILREVELANLGVLLQDDRDLRGRVNLETRIEGTSAAPVFEGVAILAGAERNGQRIPDTRAVFTYGAAELEADVELFDEGRVFASVEATLPIDLALAERTGTRLLDGPLVVDVRADSLPMDALGALTDELSDVRGALAGEFSVRGSWDAPDTEGEATLRGGRFRVEATGVRYGDVAGHLRLAGTTLTVDSLVAVARGPLRVTGEVDLSTLTEPGFDLELTAQDAWFMYTDDVQLRLDADLDVTGPFDRVVVTGDARTRRGVIYVPEVGDREVVTLDDPEVREALEGRLAGVAEGLIESPSPLLANLEVDVNLHIAPDTWLRSTDFNIEVMTPDELGPLQVLLDQRAGRLVVDGTINTERGDYSFMSRRFLVTQGSATFLGTSDPDPLVQVTAEHEVDLPGRERFSMRVVVGGTGLDPTLALESDARPPIPETDLFTYVVLGRSAGGLIQQQASALGGRGGAGGDLVGNVAGLATVQMTAIAANALLDEFEREMTRELGIDVLHIAPADLPAELFSGRFADLIRGTEIEVGRYIGPRLFASVRARPTTETRPGGTVEYRTENGYLWRMTLDPRFLPAEPTLREVDPERTSVFGAFLFRQWRF